MRFSTRQNIERSLNGMLQQQQTLNTIQTKISQGKRILRPSDDPTATQAVINNDHMIARYQQYQNNITSANTELNLKQNTLTTIATVGASLTTLAEQAEDQLTSTDELTSIADELQSNLTLLLSQANTRGSNGDYIFAGTKSDTQPFSQNGSGTYIYNGNDESREVAVSDGLDLQTTDPATGLFIFDSPVAQTARTGGTGEITFGNITNPTTWQAALPETYTLSYDGTNINVTGDQGHSSSVAYTSGNAITINGAEVTITGTLTAGTSTFTLSPLPQQDILNRLQSAITSIQTETGTTLADSVSEFQEIVETFNAKIINMQADVGVRQSLAETQETLNTSIIANQQTTNSELEDVNLVEEMGRFSTESLALEASQQAFVRMGQLSLINLL